MTVYRIHKWATHYETHDTRKIKNLCWVPISNKHGDGFMELMDHEQGDRHFAAWILLLQVASKTCERGVLVRQVGDKLVGHDAKSLARIVRMDADVMAEAMARLVAIGWLEKTQEGEAIGTSPGIAGDSPGDLPAHREIGATELNRIELKIIEREKPAANVDRLGQLLDNLMVSGTKAQRKRWHALALHEGGAVGVQSQLDCIEWAVTTARTRDGMTVNYANHVIRHANEWAKCQRSKES